MRNAILLANLWLFVSQQSLTAISIDTVPVGDVGNATDPATGNTLGGVSYAYRIGTTEVTVGQYTAFLNAVAAADPYALYGTAMATDLNVAGIARSGSSGSYTYSPIGSPNHPITHVSWGDAARFANWLNNGQPTGAEGPGTTETGAYTLNGATSNSALNSVSRNANATWVIPTLDEWYKAAFYDPSAGQYRLYATGSDSPPVSAPPGNVPNTANFKSPTTGYAVTGSTSYSISQNYLTDVGAYTSTIGPYGTFDQGGNALEWNETLILSYRGVQGGSWAKDQVGLQYNRFGSAPPSIDTSLTGFRVAMVPEPSTLTLIFIASVAALGALTREVDPKNWAR